MPPEPDHKLLHLLEGVSFQPIFIVGDHRSGTTLLYKILAETQSLQVLTAYHVIEYDQILTNHQAGLETQAKEALAARFKALGLSNRIIDNVPVGPDAPEEYGFVLEDSRRPRVRPANAERMVEICRKLQVTGAGHKPLLLKNPWDALSFAYLKTCFPNAKLIFLHRHPLGVINSQLRAIRSLIEKRNEYTALLAKWYARLLQSPAQLAMMRILFGNERALWRRIIPRHVLRVNRYFAENIGTLPAQDCFSLRYEDLCQNPRTTIEKLLAWLAVSPDVSPSYENMIVQRDPELLPEIERYRKEILEPFQPYLAAQGYRE
jgi:hypothetical protein